MNTPDYAAASVGSGTFNFRKGVKFDGGETIPTGRKTPKASGSLPKLKNFPGERPNIPVRLNFSIFSGGISVRWKQNFIIFEP